jgi:hypothetical protein
MISKRKVVAFLIVVPWAALAFFGTQPAAAQTGQCPSGTSSCPTPTPACQDQPCPTQTPTPTPKPTPKPTPDCDFDPCATNTPSPRPSGGGGSGSGGGSQPGSGGGGTLDPSDPGDAGEGTAVDPNAGAANPADNAAPDGVVYVQDPQGSGRGTSNSPTADASASPAAGPAKDVRAGDPFDISGGGFAPGAKLEITLHSNPVSLGPTKADAQGKFTSKVTIPADTPTGAHTIVVSGLAPDASPHTVSIPIVVMAAAAGESTAATGFSVPVIQHHVGLLWALGMLPVGLGFGLLYRASTRNRLRRLEVIESAETEVEMLEPSVVQHFRPAPPEIAPEPPRISISPRRRRVELTGELRPLNHEALVPVERN